MHIPPTLGDASIKIFFLWQRNLRTATVLVIGNAGIAYGQSVMSGRIRGATLIRSNPNSTGREKMKRRNFNQFEALENRICLTVSASLTDGGDLLVEGDADGPVEIRALDAETFELGNIVGKYAFGIVDAVHHRSRHDRGRSTAGAVGNTFGFD